MTGRDERVEGVIGGLGPRRENRRADAAGSAEHTGRVNQVNLNEGATASGGAGRVNLDNQVNPVNHSGGRNHPGGTNHSGGAPRPAQPKAATHASQPKDATHAPQPDTGSRGRRFSAVIRTRITVYTVLITAAILVLLGTAIAATGIAHVRSSEYDTALKYFAAARANLEKWASASTSPTLEVALYQYLRSESPGEATALAAYVGEELVTVHGAPQLDVAGDLELTEAINQHRAIPQAQIFNVRTEAGNYSVGILPISWGPQTGRLVVIQDDDKLSETALMFLRVYVGISLLALVALAGVTALTTGRMLAPLLQLRDISRRISEDDLNQRLPVNADDELAELAMSFNAMVDRLQIAFNAQRDLLNDAGHELRTPVTVVRGHLELMDVTDVEDVVHTRDLVLEELSRMHRLAEDLMTVATFDRPDFVTKAEVDVADLTLDCFEHAMMLGGGRWDIAEVAHCRISADRQRLAQALLQLANNAVKFSDEDGAFYLGSQIDGEFWLGGGAADGGGVPGSGAPGEPAPGGGAPGEPVPGEPVPGSAPGVGLPGEPVPVSSFYSPYPIEPSDHYLYLWVSDRGIGIAQRDQERIFERFVRVSHERPGSGLGLSIVQAIAAAHAGRLMVASRPGVGSIFAIQIPLSDTEEEA